MSSVSLKHSDKAPNSNSESLREQASKLRLGARGFGTCRFDRFKAPSRFDKLKALSSSKGWSRGSLGFGILRLSAGALGVLKHFLKRGIARENTA